LRVEAATWEGLVWLTQISVPYPPLARERSSIIKRESSHVWGDLVYLTQISVPYPPLPRKRSSIIERGGSHDGKFCNSTSTENIEFSY
jgi:hypothetical protein